MSAAAVLLLVTVGGLPIAALMYLTSVGATRRGSGLWLAGLEGLFFPLAWFVWYSRDELPGR